MDKLCAPKGEILYFIREAHTSKVTGNFGIYGRYCKLTYVCLIDPKAHEKYKEIHDQHDVEKTFKVGDRVWLQLNKERLWGGKEIKDLRYGLFEVLEKVKDNSYMHIYSLVNVENMELYEPSMLDKEI